jgi:hypothetical protein
LQHVEGVDPLHLAALADFIARATQISGDGYSVSVPAIFSSDPASTPPPSAQLLGLLNGRYVVSEFDVAAPGLRLVHQLAATRMYENSLAQPQARRAGGAAAQVEGWSPTRIVVRAAGPGLLLMSELAYPGWERLSIRNECRLKLWTADCAVCGSGPAHRW